MFLERIPPLVKWLAVVRIKIVLNRLTPTLGIGQLKELVPILVKLALRLLAVGLHSKLSCGCKHHNPKEL
jgi:hypothetical protein